MATIVARDLVGANPLDIRVLNICRAEPPTLVFDYYDYAGLPRSIFRHLSEIPNLEGLIEDRKSAGSIYIPSSTFNDEQTHQLVYERKGDKFLIIVNAFNNYSQECDFKYFMRQDIPRFDGKSYTANLVAVEVYREKGDHKPVWEIGLYITEKSTGLICYEESAVVTAPSSSERTKITGSFRDILDSLVDITYTADLKGIVQDPDRFVYLRPLLFSGRPISWIHPDEFAKQRDKWFFYLPGTQDIQKGKVMKFDDLYAPNGFTKYRVMLTSNHLAENPRPGEYTVQCYEGGRLRHNFGVTAPHQEALSAFTDCGEKYIRILFEHAGRPIDSAPGKKLTQMSPNPHSNLRWTSIVKDKTGVPVVIASWSTAYDTAGKKIALGQPRHHYLSMWGDAPSPLELLETINFNRGLHPRHFMRNIMAAIPHFTFGDGSQAINYFRQYGAHVRYSA